MFIESHKTCPLIIVIGSTGNAVASWYIRGETVTPRVGEKIVIGKPDTDISQVYDVVRIEHRPVENEIHILVVHQL
jgi:hypothetical protein